MLKLSVTDLIKGDENCYSFVVAVSKRARQIADEQREEEYVTEEKPVQLAVEEYIEGKYRIHQPDLDEEARLEDEREDAKMTAAVMGEATAQPEEQAKPDGEDGQAGA